MALKTIVVVDDDELDRYIVKRLVKSAGLDVDVVEFVAGDHFVDVVLDKARLKQELGETPPPVLVLLDINMPRMSGLQVLEKLSSNDADDQIVIVTMYSSSNHAQDYNDAMKYSFVKDFIVKPLTKERLTDLINSLDQ